MRLRPTGKLLAALIFIFIFLAVGALGTPLLRAQSPDPRYEALRNEMKVFEAVIDENFSQTFSPPFGILEKTKGTYLPDYGVVFSLEVNLFPIRMPTLFDVRPPTQQELEKARKVKLERIAIIKQKVPRLLADYATGLHDLAPEQTVAVVVHLFQVLAEQNEKLPNQIVMQSKKGDLDQFWDKKISFEGLKEKIKVLEF